MPAKQLHFGETARGDILSGVNKLAKCGQGDVGPRGRNVVLDKKWGPRQSTKDGVTVAKEVELDDPFENMGAQMVREVASKTSDVAGDGTTTATVWPGHFPRRPEQCHGWAQPHGHQAWHRKGRRRRHRGAQEAQQPVKDKTEISQVGTISANGDSTVGDLIAEAMDKVGKDGVITVEEAKAAETSLEVVEGMQFDRGYMSPYFVTNPERMEAVIEDAVYSLP